jgi:DNA-binding CsgD family transcriptional regulator
LAILDKLLECGRKSASTQTKLFGLLASYGIESERGDDAAIERLDSELEGLPDVLPRVRREVLLAARAMQLAWRGQFAAAYSLLDGTAQRQTDDERRAARAAEAGFYAYAAGLLEEGEAALAEASAALARCNRPTRRALRARMTIAFAELARGHTAAAHRQISEVERSLEPSMRWLKALAHVGRTIYRVALGQAEPALLAGSLERLRAAHFGGIARLIEAVPFPQSAEGAYVSLTPAEREILELLATGASTKDVAAKTGRSPRTVDTHIRSICQKLRCNGRREAVALATGSGWVKT